MKLVERLDEADGDPDIEPNGDELDGTSAEDEEGNQSSYYLPGAGCPVSDPGECNGDPEREEGSVSNYGIDQRLAAVGHGYAPWHIDKEEPLSSYSDPLRS